MAKDQNTDQASAQTQPSQIYTRTILKVLFLALAVLGALWILYRLGMIILLLILSTLFSYLIAPLVAWFERPVFIKKHLWRLSHASAIVVVYSLLLLLVGTIGYALAPALTNQFSAFIAHLPTYANKVRSLLQSLDVFARNYKVPGDWQKAISGGIAQVAGNLFEWLEAGLIRLLTLAKFLPWLVLVPILSFFMLKDAQIFRDAIVSALPTRQLRKRIDELFGDISETLAAYIRAQLMACIIVGVISFIGYMVLGPPYPLVLSVITGILEFIPLAGPLAAAIIATLLAATDSFRAAFYVLIFLLVLRVIEDYVIYPRLVGRKMEMHPLAVIVAVLSGAELGGIIGIFLAIPMMALIILVYKHWLEYRGSRGIVAELLNETSEAPRKQK